MGEVGKSEFERRKLMYPLISVFIIVVGALLLVFANKIIKMRIFSDENDKINLSLNDVGGSLLVISQFTLYADCRKGNRPNFINAGNPETAEKLFEYFIGICGKYIPVVEKGVFGADMKVELENDGPFTVVLEDI